ncbi:NLR family CARD domain-containing protein 3-like isoform X3 [Montipora capricornis]|uniref:NLR family CARD domain-containing protein 3-like isoform X3 n=1 Tax=Montipora capricornis TaxID=246305 RepID=UPI0035F18411
MASGPAVFPSTRESTNYARLCRLLVDVGSQALRDTFDRIHSPAALHRILSSTSAYYPTLQSLKNRRILNPTQWGKLYPTVCSSVSSASFDITLLVVLLRNICGFSPPASTGNWDMLPLPGDNSCEANIARIKYYRNEVYAHASQASVDDATFNMLWQYISNALLALGSGTTYASAISRLKTESMDPDFEEHYRELLKQWKKDDDNTKEELGELKEMVKSEVKEVKEMLKQWKSDEGSTKDKVGQVEEMLKQWKSDEDSTKDKVGQVEDMLKKWKSDEGSTKEKLENMEEMVKSEVREVKDGKQRKLCLSVLEECYDMPPKLRVKPPKRSDLPNASKPWRNADLPIDILLLTVEDCEFLSCFSFLDRPFKSYKKEVGPIYFGYTGNTGDQEKLKVALMKCSKGAAVPGGSLTAVKNAVRVLSPKAVFSVGTCSGLSSDKVKLGDVVVSAKLTTAAGFKTPVSRHVSDLVRDAPYGWVAPLENPDELEVEVHCDGDILSQTQAARCGCADLHLQYPEAIAVETEGEGLFAAAYDEKVEWVVVKGVARFVNETQLSRSEWMSFASTMAAFVVAKMLNDPVVFQEWPHCNQEMLTQWKKKEGDTKDNMGEIEGAEKHRGQEAYEKCSRLNKQTKFGIWSPVLNFRSHWRSRRRNFRRCRGESQLQEFIQRLKDIVISSTGHVTDLQQPFRPNPGEGPPAKDFTVDEIFVNVVIREGRVSYNFPADRWEQLKVYPMASAEQTNALRPQDIFDSCHRNVLAVGRPGIGKTLLCTRLLRFWASDDTKIQSQCEVAFLLKFRHLNSEPDLNLRELLTRAETVECLEDGLWQYIKDNPSKVLLIFDGLDEFSSTPGIARDDSRFNNTTEVRMPMGCLYKKIASRKLLQGCTLLTTVRPTAVEDVRELQFDRTVEITGFTFEQVEEFVEKFTKDDDSGKLKEIIWQHISTNINLFSLCYIPVNCFIICHCLLQLINISSDAEHKLPVKITEIYSISVKIFFYKHSRGKYSCSKTDLGCYMYKRFDELQPENDEVFKKLGKIAFNGIESGKLAFESHEVSGLEDCGLLHRLPDRKPRKLTQPSRAQYCFTHLTVQEFFAAKHLTDTLPKDELQRLVANHFRVGTWKVVMQFVAGLLEPGTRQRTTKSEIFTHLLPEKVKRTDGSDLIWWPCSKEDKVLALDVCKCLYEFDGEQKKVKIQNKGAEIGFNAVDFSQMGVVPIDCPAVMDFVRDANVISLRIDLNDVGPLGCKEIQYSLKDVNCKLTQLDLHSNNIGNQGAAHLSDALKHVNCKLTQLDLWGNKIGVQGAVHLSDALKDVNCKLTQLDLNLNPIGHQGAAHLSDALKDVNCKLTQLNLESNKIGDQGVAHLSDALKDVNCKLTQLNLHHTRIGDQGAAHLSDALKDVNCKLTQLSLGGNEIGDQGAAHLSDALKDVNCKLTQLNLGSSKIGDQGVAHLSDALKDVNCKLTQLDLESNKIGDQGAAHLSDALKDVNCKPTQLNISHNNIGDQGAAHLSDALKDVNCKLTQLNILDNNIGDQGAAHLSDALKDVNCKLTQLDLASNKIGDQGAAHLSDALKDVNCKLTQLNISYNNIGDQGAAHLSDALKDVNCKLTKLNLGGNNIGDQGAAHLSDAFKDVNCKLTQLNLQYNKIGYQGAAHLIDALKDVNCKLTEMNLEEQRRRSWSSTPE